MNKAYKIIWNKARECYVVVAEFAKTRSKSSSRSLSLLMTTGVLLSLLTSSAFASGTATVTGTSGTDDLVTIQGGTDISVTQNNGVITIGAVYDPTLETLRKYIKFNADYDLGTSLPSVAANSANSFVWGKNAAVSVYSLAEKSEKNIAIGAGSKIFAGNMGNPSKGTGSNTAIGADSSVGSSNNIYGTYDTVVGAGAKAYGGSNVVVGNSQAGLNQQIGTKSDGTKIWANVDNAVVVGSGAAAYSDKATAVGGAAIAGKKPTRTDYTDRSQAENAKITYTTAVGYGAHAFGMNSTAVGAQTVATGQQNISLGSGSEARKDNTMSVGFHAIGGAADATAIGHDAVVFGDGGLAIGHLVFTGMPALEGYRNNNLDESYIASPEGMRIAGDSKIYFRTEDGTVLKYEVKIGQNGEEDGKYYKVKAVQTGNSWKFVKVNAAGEEVSDTSPDAVQYLAKESMTKDTRTSSKVNHIDYFYIAGQESSSKIYPTDEGVAIGTYVSTEGSRAMAIGMSSTAHDANNTALGLYSNTFGKDATAIGHASLSGARGLIETNVNTGEHTVSYQVTKKGISERTTIDGTVVSYDKNFAYEFSDGTNTLKVQNGKIVAVGGTAYTQTGIKLASDNTAVYRDTETGYLYYTKSGAKHLVKPDEDVIINGSGDTLTVSAGKMMLSNGGLAIGSYTHAEGDKSVAFGNASGASGRNSVAIGKFANAYGEGSIAFGSDAVAGAEVTTNVDGHKVLAITNKTGQPVMEDGKHVSGAVAFGNYAHATANNSLAFGTDAEATAKNSVAIGSGSVSDVEDTVSIGSADKTRTIVHVTAGVDDTDAVNVSQLKSKANKNLDNIDSDGKAVIVGLTDVVSGDSIVTVTPNTNADGKKTYTITAAISGDGVVEEGNTGIVTGGTVYDAIQNYDATNGMHYVSINSSVTSAGSNYANDGATGQRAIAIGESATATAKDAVAIGYKAKAEGEGAFAFGEGATSNGKGTVAFTGGNEASGTYSMAWGMNNVAGISADGTETFTGATAFGTGTEARNDGATAMGNWTIAEGQNSVAMGNGARTREDAKASLAMGQDTQAAGTGSFAGGTDSIAGGFNSFAHGYTAEAVGSTAIAMGDDAKAVGDESVALGYNSKAYGDYSVAILGGRTGDGSFEYDDDTGEYDVDVTDNAIGAFAAGFGSVAMKDYTVAIGRHATVENDQSIALGEDATVVADSSVALGYGSVATEENVISVGHKAGDPTYNVGTYSAALNRKIVNVAEGVDDTDAVNVAQLKKVADSVDTAKTHYYSVNSPKQADNYNNDGATKDYALAAGPAAKADGIGAVAIGHGAVSGSIDGAIAIGENALIKHSNGNPPNSGSGDVAIGSNSYIDNYVNQGGSVAIGKNAKVENMAGSQERIFAFGQTKWNQSSFWGMYYGAAIPEDPSKAVSSIAIGDNTYARTGSVMIGPHNYNGDLGDKTVNMEEKHKLGVDVFATTIGANSYTNGAFATNTGAYNIISGSYSGGNSDSSKASQNFGATITGSLNSIESSKAGNFSGIANSIVGVANRTNNSNGSLIFGAGNVITNSITDLDGTQEVADSAKKFQQNLIDSVKAAESGGAALAIGGSNTIDYAQKSQVMGVGNTLKGEDGNISKFNFIDGYKNSAEKVNNVYIIGANNTVKNGNNNIVFGDKRTMDGQSENIIIGSGEGDDGLATTVSKAIIIGKKANATTEGGIAIGENSVASTAAGEIGYDLRKDGQSSETSAIWKATNAAVSVGNGKTLTRQITGVAAGTEDTDAVNVAQLKKARYTAGTNVSIDANNVISAVDTKYTAGTNVKIDENNVISAVDTKYTAGTNVKIDENNVISAVDTDTTYTAGDNVTIDADNKISATDTKYELSSSTKGNTTTISLKDKAGNDAGSAEVKNDTLQAGTSGLSLNGTELSMAVTDTAGNTVSGKVDLKKIKSAVDTDTQYELSGEKKGNTTTISLKDKAGNAAGSATITDANDTLDKTSEGLKLDGNNLSLSVKDTAGNEIKSSVDLSGLKVTDTNTTYDMTAEAKGEKGTSTQTTTVTFTDKTDASKSTTFTVDNDTLKNNNKGLTFDGTTLTMDVEDTAGNKVTGSVDLSGLKVTDTNTTYTLTGKENGDNTTTLTFKDSDGKSNDMTENGDNTTTLTFKGSDGKSNDMTVATKDTNTTYTLTGKENGNNTTTLTFKDSDGKSNDMTVATKDTRNTLKAGGHISLAEKGQDDGSTEYTVSVKADGKVASGDTGLVTGDTVSKETRTASDGFVTKTSSTAGENILALDKRVKTNADNINNINQTVNNMGSRINKLGTRINKVGAGAAALAALHPQDFDPDDKWDVAAGYGNYKDANAAAVGAFYHPNEDTMISVGGSFGGGENMVNAGVSVKLGQGNHVTTSRVAMAREILDMKQKMEKLEAQNQYLMKRLGAAPEGALKDVNFPDVPKDHWAYQYVKTLADKGYIEGYPDGEFKGDRAMTRYEYAAVIYRALQNGAPVDDKMAKVLDEFEPELDHIQKAARFRVDRISGKDEDRGKVERVRVNNEEEERDVYGGKIPAALKK